MKRPDATQSALYFAYGSNLKLSEMQSTCPSARRLDVARLSDHTLDFPRWSKRRHCGVAGIVPQAGRGVWGGVYEIDASELPSLDRREGYAPLGSANSYERRDVIVHIRGDSSRCLTVCTYYANPQPGVHKPSQEYVDLLVAGALQWDLPEEYVEELKGVEVQ